MGEQFGLRWADVDIECGILTLPHTKAGHVQYAPLNAPLIISRPRSRLLQALGSQHLASLRRPSEGRTRHNSNGTVTKTVTGTTAEEEKPIEVVESVGAGDGI